MSSSTFLAISMLSLNYSSLSSSVALGRCPALFFSQRSSSRVSPIKERMIKTTPATRLPLFSKLPIPIILIKLGYVAYHFYEFSSNLPFFFLSLSSASDIAMACFTSYYSSSKAPKLKAISSTSGISSLGFCLSFYFFFSLSCSLALFCYSIKALSSLTRSATQRP